MKMAKCFQIEWFDYKKPKNPKFDSKIYKERYFNIDLNNSLVGYVKIYTDEYFKESESTLEVLNETKSNLKKYKITFIDNKRVEATRLVSRDEILERYEKIFIDLSSGTVEDYEILKSYLREKKVYGGKLQCSKISSKGSYLDYWWAVILIIAITFFIFTQSGKRLKKIRRK